MAKYKVFDNFLSNSDFIELTNNMSPPTSFNEIVKPNQLGWIYAPGQAKGNWISKVERFEKITNIKPLNPLHQWVFGHVFFIAGYISPVMYILNTLLQKINPLALSRIQANFTVQQEKRGRSGFHIDLGDEPFKHTSPITSIFYMNTTNGPTILEDGTEIECRANRLVSYPHNTYHAGVLCTDQPYRIVINLNYFKDLDFS